jgi:carbamoyltransferase
MDSQKTSVIYPVAKKISNKDDVNVTRLHLKDVTFHPQMVNSRNPGYRSVLKSIEENTGVGGLSNTSFNLHGYPLVGTPEIAIHTLKIVI